MFLPQIEPQKPVQTRLYERSQFRASPGPYYRDVFEPVTRTPEEVDDAIYRNEPLSPADPGLGVAESSSIVAAASPTRSLSSMLVPSSTPVPTALLVSTLTASSIITTAPEDTGIVLVVHETDQSETVTAGQNPWEIPEANTGTKFVIFALASSIPLLILLVMGTDICRRYIYPPLGNGRDAWRYERGQKKAEAVAAERAKKAAEAARNEKKNGGGGDDNNRGDGSAEAKKSSSTDSTVVVPNTNTAPFPHSNPSTTTTLGTASSGNGGPSSNKTKKIMFNDDVGSITPAPKADHITPRTADEAAAATYRSIHPTFTLAGTPRSLTNLAAAVKPCRKGKALEQQQSTTTTVTSDKHKPAYLTASDHNPAYGPSTKAIPSYTVAGASRGDRPLSKISEETKMGSSVVIDSSGAESLDTAIRQNMRLHSLISRGDESAAAGNHYDHRRSNSSASTVKAVGAAL